MKIKKSIAIALLAASIQASADNVLSIRDTITDPHLVYPESYEADTHKMRNGWYMQNYVKLGDATTSKNDVPTTDEQFIERLRKMPTIIEMPYNSLVKSCIIRYTQRHRNLVENLLGLSTYYMPIFEQALEAEGVPLELKYLPVIESALNPTAVSRAGATGIWQFMLATARGLGMEINSLVDERRDPYMASKMAARFLHQLYSMYDDWSLAIAAYNCGPGNVNNALRKAGGGKKDFWEIYRFLPQETRGYVPAFIAANYVMNYYDKHGISPALAKKPILTDTVHVTKRIHFKQISEVLNIPVEELRTLNPQYRQDIIPGDIKPYVLVLPSFQALSYGVSQDSIAAHNAHLYSRRDVVEPSDGTKTSTADGDYIITQIVKYHKVKKGETFNSIAKKYGVTASSIKQANGIKTLRRGRTIKIVITKREPKPADEAKAETTQPNDSTRQGELHEVKTVASETISEPNDTTTLIAEVVETEVVKEPVVEKKQEQPKKKNDRTKQQKKDRAQYHKVKSGESLNRIASKNGTTVEKLRKLNPNIKGNTIHPGQNIRVK